MSGYWVLRTVDRKQERNSRGIPLWAQVIAGPMSILEAEALVQDFESEPEKNEAFSRFWAAQEEQLDEASRFGAHSIGPGANPSEVTAVRRRLIGKENEPLPRVHAPDCYAHDTLGLVAGILKDGVIYSPSGQRLGHIERDAERPGHYWIGDKTGVSLYEAYPTARDPRVTAVITYHGDTLGYLTPDGIMHRLSADGSEMGFAGVVMPLQADPTIRVALGATLIDLLSGDTPGKPRAEQREMMDEDFDTWFRDMSQEHNRNLERKRAEQRKQIEKIERTGNNRDKALLDELLGNVEELRQLDEQVGRGQIESMPVYDDPTRPGTRYLERIDGDIQMTRNEDTQALFRELEEEASWWRREIGAKLRPWMYRP